MPFGFGARRLAGLAGAAAFCAVALGSVPAQAWWRGGVWVSVPPVVVAPPVAYPYYYPPYYPYAPGYYYPPGYYAPPAVASVPPAQTSTQTTTTQTQTSDARPVLYGSTCYAGVYVCAAPGGTPVGAGCSCPGIGAPSYGSVH